jgi:hypothetical protein
MIASENPAPRKAPCSATVAFVRGKSLALSRFRVPDAPPATRCCLWCEEGEGEEEATRTNCARVRGREHAGVESGGGKGSRFLCLRCVGAGLLRVTGFIRHSAQAILVPIVWSLFPGG